MISAEFPGVGIGVVGLPEDGSGAVGSLLPVGTFVGDAVTGFLEGGNVVIGWEVPGDCGAGVGRGVGGGVGSGSAGAAGGGIGFGVGFGVESGATSGSGVWGEDAGSSSAQSLLQSP